MRRYFNTEGQCDPKIHYMIDLEERLEKIRKRYVEKGKYFMINRGRQYGKTTTLRLLADHLKEEYFVFLLDFQEIGTEEFRDEAFFSKAFTEIMVHAYKTGIEIEKKEELLKPLLSFLKNTENLSMRKMFEQLSKICVVFPKPIVLIIDEVDSASNNQVFIDFLALLRKYYLNRDDQPIFHSVILAGVYDIKNLKLKLRPDGEHKYNSPWNIAAKFTIEMNFPAIEIASMLREYENDNHTGMNIQEVSECIYEYTSGYPYLVSAICKCLDEELSEDSNYKGELIWTKAGVAGAVKSMISDPSVTLFKSMVKQIAEYPDMKRMLNAILFQGKRITYNPDNPVIDLAEMFGYIINRENGVQVANRIFEMRLYNFFLSEEELTNAIYDAAQENTGQFVKNGHLDMERILEKFVTHFTDIYEGSEETFIEDYGRKFFLLYLKPVINGVGNFYIEAQTRDARRADVIVDYRGEQFIVEMKIWRGNEYNERGEKQLAEYLDYFRQKKGYMVSFNFNKKKEIGVKTITVGDKVIVEAVV